MRAIRSFKTRKGNTSYRVRFRLNERQTSETFDTYADAERFATLLELLDPQGAVDQYYAEDRAEAIPLLDDYAEQHIATLTNVTDGTRVSYRRMYSRVWSPRFGHLPLHHIDRRMVATAVNEIADEGKADKTIANAHGLLAGIMKSAMLDGHLARSPCTGMKLPRRTEHTSAEIRFLTKVEFAILYAAMVPHFQPMLSVMAGTGMRWGEIEGLQVKSINHRAPSISITRSAKWNASKSARSFGPPKTRKARRTISIPDELVPTLLTLTQGKHRDDLVFTMPKGGQLRHATFHNRYWVPACEASGLGEPRPTIHGIRHSHVAWLIAEGVQMPVIQARLGHQSITTTIDTYGHLLPETQQSSALAAGSVFRGMPALDQ